MAQFDVYRNPNPATRGDLPYLLDVQSDLMAGLATRKVATAMTIQTLTPQVAGIPGKGLGPRWRISPVAGGKSSPPLTCRLPGFEITPTRHAHRVAGQAVSCALEGQW